MSQVIGSPDREAQLQVYRCSNSHWHFVPHYNDDNRANPPWYRCKVGYDDNKFWDRSSVYVQGRGKEKMTVIHSLESGFYYLRNDRGDEEWCMGRYGKRDRMIYREEELSATPWEENSRGPPPAYDSKSPGYPGDGDEKSGSSKK